MMDGTKPQPDTNVLYSPPAPEELEAFAHQACQHLGSEYGKDEVVQGFTAFVKVVATINVRYRNFQSGGLLDNDVE